MWTKNELYYRTVFWYCTCSKYYHFVTQYAIECLLCEHNLSLSKLHKQGYDQASNMQGDINSLKTLILKENKSAFCVRCFAHQLQLTLVAVAKNHINIAEFFLCD